MFNDIGKVLLISLMYDTPMLLSPCHVDIAPSPATSTSNKKQNGHIGMSHLSLLAAILTRWWHLVAFQKALNLLHRAMCVVTYQRIAMAINLATFLESFVDCCLFFCCPGGRWGNTELVVTRCRRPGASSVALDFLNLI